MFPLHPLLVLFSIYCNIGVDNRQRNNSPLHRASLHGRESVARLLIENGAKLNARNQVFVLFSILIVPSFLCRALLPVTIEFNMKDGETPLHKAAQWCHIAVTQLLIARGADVNALDLVRRGRQLCHLYQSL